MLVKKTPFMEETLLGPYSMGQDRIYVTSSLNHSTPKHVTN